MNTSVIYTILSRLFFGGGLLLLFPALTALFYRESLIPFCATAALSLVLAFLFRKKGLPSVKDMNARECLAVISLSWLSISFLYLFPYLLSGLLSPLDAIVESISGLTGTGGTVFSDVGIIPKSLLLFRSLTLWVGGLGIIVIFTALFPQVSKGSARLMHIESTNFSSSRAVPRIKEMAKALFIVYFLFTAISTLTYFLLGMNFFDALNHGLSTISTGGFSTRNESIGAYDGTLLRMAVFFFMVISSANFGLYVAAWHRGISLIFKDAEFKVYLAIVMIAGLVITGDLLTSGSLPLPAALTEAFFSAGAFASTTGFISCDFSYWPAFSQFILLLIFLVGGCGGSTAGGLKVFRLILLVKSLRILLRQKLHPQEILQVGMGKEAFHADTLLHIFYFFFIYMFFIFLWALLMIISGLDIPHALSLSMATMSNTGVVLGQLGSFPHWADLPAGTKIIACISMLMGRLESFTLLSLCFPSFWRKNTW